MPVGIKGRTALVAGANQGFGRHLFEQLRGWGRNRGAALMTRRPEDVLTLRTRQWRRLERRAVDGYERDLLAALEELCAGHSVVTGIEVDPVAGRTATIGLGDRRLVLGPLAPVGLALLSQARRDGGILRLDAVGRYGPYWWLRLSTAAQPVTLLGYTLRLSSNGGGAPVTPVPDRPEVTDTLTRLS
jgi:hypothetical protein